MEIPATPPIIMDKEIFNRCTRFMYEAYVQQVSHHLFSKSQSWIFENIPLIAYDKEICKFIINTFACIDITETLRIYEVGGQWVRIIEN